MFDAGLHSFEPVLLILLALVAALAVAAKRIQIPYPIVMVIGGLLLSFIPHVPQPHLAPDVVFLVFLPPLLFSASFHISWRDFRNSLVSIVLLAFGLVGFTVYGVALTTRSVLNGFDWKLGLVLGSVVATTDAIAATATAKRLGLPRHITDLLEAESLVNDGSGLLALNFTVAILVSGATPTVVGGVLQLAYLIAAAVVLGIAAGYIVRFFQTRISDAPVEITISLVTPYVVYLSAEAIHCSGVLATIACGLFLGRHSSGFYSLHARLESSAFWRTLDFILNGLVFLLLGLQLPSILSDIRGMGLRELCVDGLLFCAIVIGLRLLWVYPGAWLSQQIRHRILQQKVTPIDKREVFLVGWAGMRGVLALAAALSLPEKLNNGSPFPQRSLILFLTFCVIMATLVFQGLTMPTLIRTLGLAGRSESAQEETWARHQMIHAALDFLKRSKEQDPSIAEAADTLADFYTRELSLSDKPDADGGSDSRADAAKRRKLARRTRAVERQLILKLRNENRIHDEVLRTLERELDLLDARFAQIDEVA